MYHIQNTLNIFPYISYVVISICWVFLEIKAIKDQVGEKEAADPGRGGFIPPNGKEGYEYFVSKSGPPVLVYICKKTKDQYKVYVVQGNPPNVKMKHDRNGEYFNVHAQEGFAVEKIVDQVYSNVD